MSEERKKRQQARAASAAGTGARKSLTLAAVLIICAALYYSAWHYRSHKYDKFAQCLTAKQATMYGLFYCPHCAEQKEMFGQSFHHIHYVECALKGPPAPELAPECKAAGVSLFPSWQFGADPPKEGVLSLEELSQKSGCSLP
jgi:hypothetical protein